MRRSLALYATLLAATILLGLATRAHPALFPSVVARFGGDVLWAVMVFWIAALWARAASTARLASTSLAIAYAVEFSQLYRAPWLDAIRADRLGGLALGQGFLWSDLVCYTLGVMLAAAVDRRVHRSASRAKIR